MEAAEFDLQRHNEFMTCRLAGMVRCHDNEVILWRNRCGALIRQNSNTDWNPVKSPVGPWGMHPTSLVPGIIMTTKAKERTKPELSGCFFV